VQLAPQNESGHEQYRETQSDAEKNKRPRVLTPNLHSPILWFRRIPLATLSRFLFPYREAARKHKSGVRVILD
jgi:hypothetical protein